MPIFIKSREQVCSERANNDAIYYYDYFIKLLIDNNNEEKDMQTKQDLVRLYKWIEQYKSFSYSYHFNNFIPADDLYVDNNDALIFSYCTKIPKAIFIEVFEDIEYASI